MKEKEKKNNGERQKRRKGGEGMKKDMDNILSDPRFAHVASDLRLRHVPKEERRVKLDSRFHSVLTDEKFYEKTSMDPRGRKGNYSTKEDLLKFYQLSSEEDSDDEGNDGGKEDTDEDEDRGKEGEVKDSDDGWKEDTDEDRDRGKEGEVEEEEEIEENEEEEIEQNEEDNSTCENKKETTTIGEKSKASNIKDVESIEKYKDQLEDMTLDYARGEVFFSDDSSDDDDSTDDEEGAEFEWGELDRDAVWDNEQDVQETSRFAVCNLDWDRIKAADIMILFSSFCPRGGSVKHVTIYPSEYGKQRLAEEDQKGPQELRRRGTQESDNLDLVDLDKLEQGKLDHSAGATRGDYEALRRYQRNRLRYYYAVVKCDSVDTARTIYIECDRQPYEGAGILLDLRYIPDDMTFDEAPHDMCQKVPETYEVKNFTTTALHDSRPILTWDETDPDRRKTLTAAMTKAMKGDKLDDYSLKDLIASSSEEDEGLALDDDESDSDSEDETTKASRIAKFRALITEIDAKERRKKEREIDLEETFDLKESKEEEGSDEEAEEEEEEGKSNLNPFERILEKKKAKRKERKERRKKKKKGKADENDESDGSADMSDDELPDDADGLYDDPFFAEELKKRKTDKKKKKSESLNSDGDADAEEQGKLELLLMNEDAEDQKHFSMREIIDTNKEKKKRRKSKLKKKKEESILQKQKKVDDFKITMSDPRFTPLLTSGDFNIDPSHPQFKRTKAMDTLIGEVQKKRVAASFEDVPDSKRIRPEERSSHELSALVKKVKNKTKKSNIKH